MVSYGAKGAILGACNESLVVGIDVGIGDVGRSSTPVIRVVLPDDGAETKCVSDGTDTVVDVTKGRLSERVSMEMSGQERDTHAPACRCDTDNQFDYFHLQGVSKLSDKERMRIQLQKG